MMCFHFDQTMETFMLSQEPNDLLLRRAEIFFEIQEWVTSQLADGLTRRRQLANV